MNASKLLLSAVLCGATGLATAQMTPNPNPTPGMPGTSPTGQPGRPGTMGGEVPDNIGGQTNSGQTNPGQNSTQVPKVDDPTLERDVKQQLASDPAFSAVQVAAHNGRVELTGSVPSKEDRKKAKDRVKSVPGVSSVKEHLNVGAATSANPGMTSGINSGSTPNSSGQNTAGSISGNAGTSSSTDKTSHQGTSPTENQGTPQPTDTSNPHANVTTPQGSGARLVNAAYQQSGAATDSNQTQSPPNPHDNANAPADNSAPLNISLTPADGQRSTGNSTLQSQIENALRNEPSLTNSHIGVNVTDSTIDLNGTVSSSKDKQSADRIAQSFGVNRKLNDKLTVTGHGHSDTAPDHPAMNNSGTSNAELSSSQSH